MTLKDLERSSRKRCQTGRQSDICTRKGSWDGERVKDSDAFQNSSSASRQRSRCKIRKGVLYHKGQTARKDRDNLQLVLSPKYRLKALQWCYSDDIRHHRPGKDTGLVKGSLLLAQYAEGCCPTHQKYCERCLKLKAKPERMKLQSIKAT